LKQKIKYLVSLGDIKSKLLWLLLTKGTRYQFLFLTHSAKPITGSSSESESSTSLTKETFLLQFFLGSKP
jgi:hypothetical protein